jgi:hypothetical protein
MGRMEAAVVSYLQQRGSSAASETQAADRICGVADFMLSADLLFPNDLIMVASHLTLRRDEALHIGSK